METILSKKCFPSLLVFIPTNYFFVSNSNECLQIVRFSIRKFEMKHFSLFFIEYEFCFRSFVFGVLFIEAKVKLTTNRC